MEDKTKMNRGQTGLYLHHLQRDLHAGTVGKIIGKSSLGEPVLKFPVYNRKKDSFGGSQWRHLLEAMINFVNFHE